MTVDTRAWSGRTTEELAVLDRRDREGLWHFGGHELRVTNLDRVLFPPAPADPRRPSAT